MSGHRYSPAARFALAWVLPVVIGVVVMLGTLLLFRPEGAWYFIAISVAGGVTGAAAVTAGVKLGTFPRRIHDPFTPPRHR